MESNYGSNSRRLTQTLSRLEAPVLIVSTVVGRGMYSIGEAVLELLQGACEVHHVPLEEMLPPRAVNEDFARYKFISSKFPFLLYLVYKVPIIYYRKLLREKLFRLDDLSLITKEIRSRNIKSVLTISHRATFWLSALKRRGEADFRLVGMSGEFGRSLGWKYIFWEVMDDYLSPMPEKERDFPFPPHMRFETIELPVRKAYHDIALHGGSPQKTLIVLGHWGQGSFEKIIGALSEKCPELKIHVVCGENVEAYRALERRYKDASRVEIHGELQSLAGLMGECGSVITKPGISTVLETHAAGRQLFLVRGMPVAEDHNAWHAVEHFGAQWFSMESFTNWYREAGKAV